jgi:hypothetical protein
MYGNLNTTLFPWLMYEVNKIHIKIKYIQCIHESKTDSKELDLP